MKEEHLITDFCSAIILTLLTISPFILGLLLYIWLNPITCIEKILSLGVITIICISEAVIAWSIVLNR